MVSGLIKKCCCALSSVLLLVAAGVNAETANTPVTASGNIIAPAPIKGTNPFSSGVTATNSTTPLVLHENELLSQSIKSWVNGNGYKLFWNSKKDFIIYSAITLNGKSNDEILQSLGELFFAENYGLVVKNYQKNRVIVIDEM